MEAFDHLKELIDAQNKIAHELEQTIKYAENSNILEQNSILQREIERLTDGLKLAEENLDMLSLENKQLKGQLFDHMFNERARLLDSSVNRAEAYFSSKIENEKNRLSLLESNIIRKCDEYMEFLKNKCIDAENSLNNNLRMLKESAIPEIERLRLQAEEAEHALYSEKDVEFERLRKEPLSVEEAARYDKGNNMESFLGLKVLNKVAIIVIIFGVIALGRYTLPLFTNEAKSALIFLLGLIMLAGGEFINRKNANVFSIGLTGGGIATLYIAATLSFFYMKIMSAPVALLICVLISFVALILSNRYNAQVIAIFALIGGYLSTIFVKQANPGFDSAENNLIYYQLVYFTMLGLFSLLISLMKKWNIAQYVGFFFHYTAAANGIFLALPRSNDSAFVALIYAVLMFAIYSLIPLISTYRTKMKLNMHDNILLGLNIALGSGMLFATLTAYHLDWESAALLALCVWHIIIGFASEKLLKPEKICQVIHYVTAVVFAVLIVPVHFGTEYLSLGWLMEGTGLLICGILMNNRGLKATGWAIGALCLAGFAFIDSITLSKTSDAFFIRYLSITLCSALITIACFHSQEPLHEGIRGFKTAVLLNIWIFLVYTIETRIPRILPDGLWESRYEFILHLLSVSATFIWAYTVARAKPISDISMRAASIIVTILGIMWLLVLNLSFKPSRMNNMPLAIIVLAAVVSLIVNLMSVFMFVDIIKRLVTKRALSIEWYPVAAASFMLLLVTQNLYAIMELELTSIIFTVLFAASALAFILYGFAKRYLYIRITGLGLAFAVTVKLFIVDLSFLSDQMRIVSYFGLGTALLAISFVYQHFDRELKKKI